MKDEQVIQIIEEYAKSENIAPSQLFKQHGFSPRAFTVKKSNVKAGIAGVPRWWRMLADVIRKNNEKK